LTNKSKKIEDPVHPALDCATSAEELIKAALSKKGFDPVLMDLRKVTTLTDYFLIVSANSAKHVTAVADAVMEHAKLLKLPRYSVEGIHQGNWALMDYGDIIVHIFQPAVREFYDLEGLWSEAPRVVFSGDLAREVAAARQASDDEGSFSYED
jgi:ribosome-associated protein